MKILFLGDIVGKPGRRAVRELLPELTAREAVDLVIANAENAAGGFGITREIVEDLFGYGVHVLTTGNHVWDKKETLDFIGDYESLLRPANYPDGVPGRGTVIMPAPGGARVAVVNVMGRVFMPQTDCPFRTVERELSRIGGRTPLVVVDLHAETTSEKMAMGWYLDGRVTAVIGTHTHVQTADERVLPQGTAYITDSGMTGPFDSVIGTRKEIILERFLTHIPNKFEVAKGDVRLQGVVIEADAKSGRALSIRRVSLGL
ncbi:MAG TPA: TIGR00282 family metallophosphoesterase [Syntrophales bacterium]|nr:TIGR00282 family metallophosphoesterase [Syntrophales bacterium]HOM07534.1 TIGR00282 family metallophosphoesterase [Syntrophales bacterium]HON99861.1 TIGR00282 family metallophosphoesterase [Syntrophales bacterium]HPC02011.1 TIGR00282 family metallophosphoesterase [Syntrophales bacterium]HPQ07121.1 TIGR00282 family metallophosphoesterase [Syntrophales bacterium]